MPGLVVNGQQIVVPGLNVTSWLDDPALRLQIAPRPDGQRDGAPRDPNIWVRSIVVHTTGGIPGGKNLRPQTIKPGLGRGTDAGRREVHWWSSPKQQAGAGLIVDFDAKIYCTADVIREITFHAPPVSGISVGIEIAQGVDGSLYDGQLGAVVVLIDALTRILGIQRQFHWPYHKGPIARLVKGGEDVVGVYGHRDASSSRGLGDPGDAIFGQLRAAGYEAWDFAADADKAAWKPRQAALGQGQDGIPGRLTTRALKAAGKPQGMWVPRPGDVPSAPLVA